MIGCGWGGSNAANQGGDYGTVGVPAAGNVPGGRWGAASWTDTAGNLWLFGGEAPDGGGLNDLWKYTPSTGAWTWMCGSNTENQPSVYGTLGVAAAGNIPGARWFAASWVDLSGNFWLFGGTTWAGTSQANVNDLWKYTPSTGAWTWMGGSNTPNQSGVYGTPGMPATANMPGARQGAASWTDPSGNLWLFGGDGLGINNNQSVGGGAYDLNDLWKYAPSSGEWTWMGGSDGAADAGVYGTIGTPATSNFPGARDHPVSWTDASGNLWLFGGIGFGSVGIGSGGTEGYLNDLWELTPSTGEWTWMSGGSTPNKPAVYGTLGLPAAGNTPGGLWGSVSWRDSSGDLWVFGGIDVSGYLWNDLWKYTPSAGEWTWMAGSTTRNQGGVYGTLGVPAAGNVPGGREAAVSWTDASGNLWLFSGVGFPAIVNSGSLNDLWEYTPAITGPVAAPTFSPAGGTYTTAQTVTISDATAGATIYYTTNGATPTASSTLYSGPIAVSSSERIEAIATASGYANSSVASATYTINIPVAATPTFSPAAGTYTSAQTVTISDATNGATIYYTTNGTTPTTSSSVYSGPITVSSSETIEAIAVASGYANSSVASAVYTITTASFTLSASPASVTVVQGSNATSTITVTNVGGFSGTVTLAASGLPSGVTSSFAAGSQTGTQVLTLMAGASAAVTSTPVTVTITGTSGSVSATTTIALTVTAPPFGPGSGATTSITVTPGATTGNTGTISVVGANGFSGTVNLSCAVTTSMTSVNDMPTCSLNPTSVTLSGTTAQTSTLTVTTTASSTAKNEMLRLFGPAAGGTVLALVAFFVVPRRRRNWPAMLGLLLVLLSAGVMGCGGGGGGNGGGGGGGGGGNPGTTAGNYTITVTGTSGSVTAAVGTISLTVQ